MADNHYMDELARQQLGAYEAEFMEGDWSSMESMLDRRKRKRGIIWWPLAGAAAALLLWGLLPNQPESVLLPLSANDASPVQAPVAESYSETDITEEGISTQPLSPSDTDATESIVDEPTGHESTSLPSPKALPPVQGSNLDFISTLQEAATTGSHDISGTPLSGTTLAANEAEAAHNSRDMEYLLPIGIDEQNEPGSVETEWLLGSRNWSPSTSQLQWVAGLYGYADAQQVTNRAVGGGQGIWTGVIFRQRWQVGAGIGTQTMRYNEPGSLDTINSQVHLNTEATMQYLDIPIHVHYQLPITARWQVYGGIGIHLWRNLREEYIFTYQDVSATPTALASAIYETTLQLQGNQREVADFLAVNQTASSGAIPADVLLPDKFLGAAAVYGGMSYVVSTRFDVGAGFRYHSPLRPLGIEQKKFHSIGLSAMIRYRLR